MKYLVKALFASGIVLIFYSCSFYETPSYHKHPSKYPVFELKDSLHGYLSPERSCYNVTYYALNVSIEPAKKRIQGGVKIQLEIQEQCDVIQFNLAEHFIVDSVVVENDKKTEIKRKENAIFVLFSAPQPKGKFIEVSIYYQGKPQVAKRPPWQGGMVWKKKKGKHFCGVACEDDGAHIWWPLKDHLTDKPDSMETRYTVPKDHFCVGNGRLVEKTLETDGRNTFVWRTSYPINSYNVTFYIGDYVHFSIPYDGKENRLGEKLSQLDFYVLRENESKAKEHFKQAVDILHVFEKYFGPYPWPKDGYKLVESPYEGMEHQTAIAYGNGYKNGKWTGYDYIILHETAHEWWGNYVTACDLGDMWIHEGFATYSEMIYDEVSRGKDAYDISYAINRATSKNKRPIVGPMDVNYSNFKDGDIYVKGATVLHMLRRVIAKDVLFFEIIFDFAQMGEHCVCTEDFIKLVNEKTKEDYQWFFDQYVYRREAPEFFYNLTALDSNGKAELRYVWNLEVTNEDFKLPIYLMINGHKKQIHPTDKVQVLQIHANQYNGIYYDKEDYVRFTRNKEL